MGLKNKIRLGFLSLALLLFFSGIISYFELSRLSHSTHSMLGASFRNMELSKTMLDAVQDQNTALLQMIVSGSRDSDSMLIVGRQKFDSSMREANVLIRDLQGFDSIYAANVAYNRIVDAYLSDSLHKNSVGWYVAEAGRQPWIVFGLQKTSDAVSPNLTGADVWLTMAGFTVLYLVLAIAALWIAMRFIKKTQISFEEGRDA